MSWESESAFINTIGEGEAELCFSQEQLGESGELMQEWELEQIEESLFTM
jgi:hypothetical protein